MKVTVHYTDGGTTEHRRKVKIGTAWGTERIETPNNYIETVTVPDDLDPDLIDLIAIGIAVGGKDLTPTNFDWIAHAELGWPEEGVAGVIERGRIKKVEIER